MTPHLVAESSSAAELSDAIGKFVALLDEGEAPDIDQFAAGFSPEVRAELRTRCKKVLQSCRAGQEAGRGPSQLGDFAILGPLGTGGAGDVWKANDLVLNRTVAIKQLRNPTSGGRIDPRFRKEIEIVARLEHPNIVKFLGWRADDHGGLFLILELVEGGSLAERFDPKLGKSMTTIEAAALVQEIALAVQHMHERNVLHRDLKPANVLLTLDNMPKVADFGVAKILDAPALTVDNARIGTPQYMAPEQAKGDVQALGPWTDVHALGLILYECITGQPAFTGSETEVLAAVLNHVPKTPRQIKPAIEPALDAICMKCLHKDWRLRYASALDLAADLGRFRRGEPISIRPPGVMSQLRHWCRQHPLITAMSALTGLFLLVLAVTVWILQQNALRANQHKLAEADFDAAMRLCHEHDVANGMLRFVDSLELATKAGAPHLERAIRLNLAAWAEELHACTSRTPLPSTADAGKLRLAMLAPLADKSVRILAAHERQAAVNLWRWRDGHVEREHDLTGPGAKATARVSAMALSRNGKVCFIGIDPAGADVPASSVIWKRLDDAKAEPHPLAERASVQAAAFSPDGALLATGARDGTVRLWDVATLLPRDPPLRFGHAVTALALRADGKVVVVGTAGGETIAWDLIAGRPVASFQSDPVHQILTVAAAPKAGWAVTGTADTRAYVWDTTTGRAALFGPLRHRFWVSCLAIADAEHAIATGDFHRAVRLWDARTGDQLGANLWHEQNVLAVEFLGDKGVISVDAAATVYVWRLATRNLVAELPCKEPVWSLRFADDGNRLLVAAGAYRGPGSSSLWRFAPEIKLLRRHEQEKEIYGVAFDPRDPARFFAACHDGNVARVPVGAEAPETFRLEQRIRCLAPSPDGAWLLVGGGDARAPIQGQAYLIDSRTGKQLASSDPCTKLITAVAVHRERDRTLGLIVEPAHANLRHGAIRVFDFTGGSFDTELLAIDPPAEPREAVFFGDGKSILFGCTDGQVYWRDLAGAGPLQWLRVCDPGFDVNTVAAHPSDRRLILTGSNQRVGQIWDLAAMKPIGPSWRHQHTVGAVRFSADGAYAATGSLDAMVRVWRCPSLLDGSVWFGHPANLRMQIQRQVGKTP